MNVVVTVAGHSRRFQKAGYSTPKAYIEIDGQPMIHRVVSMFRPDDKFYFIALKEHMHNMEYKSILQSAAPCSQIIEIDGHEDGPVRSALFADEYIDDEEPVIISYCDFYQHWNYRSFLRTADNYDGAISAFRGFHPASFGTTYYAYLNVDPLCELIELREKKSFSENRHEEFASSGVYYLSAWRKYRQYATYLLENNIRVGSECYVSLIYNLMVADGLRIGVFEVDRFVCWGTPEDLHEYLFWSDYFHNDAPAISSRKAAL